MSIIYCVYEGMGFFFPNEVKRIVIKANEFRQDILRRDYYRI